MSVSLLSKARVHVGALLVGDPIADGGEIFTTGSVPALTVAITGVTIGNAPTVTATPASGSWVAGDIVAITGFKGTTLGGLPDGLYIVATGGATSFILGTSVTTTGTYPTATGVASLVSNRTTAANLVISGITLSSGVATITTTGAHNLSIGQQVGITALSGLAALPSAGSNGLSPISQLAGPFVVSASGFTTTAVQLNYLSTGAPVLMSGTYVANSGSLVPGPVIASPVTVRGMYSTATASLTLAPATGAGASASVKVTGVQVGDLIQAIPPVVANTNTTFSAVVTAPGVVTITVVAGSNATGNLTGVWTLLWTRLVA